MDNALEILRERGLVEDTTSEKLGVVLASPVTVYAGFDPTSPSLGLGNLVTIMVLSGRVAQMTNDYYARHRTV